MMVLSMLNNSPHDELCLVHCLVPSDQSRLESALSYPTSTSMYMYVHMGVVHEE